LLHLTQNSKAKPCRIRVKKEETDIFRSATQGSFHSQTILLVDAVRKFALSLSSNRIFGEETKNLCSQGNARATITPKPVRSILVGREPLCHILFRKSKQKSGIIHFKTRMLNSPVTSAEQIRMHTSILFMRMKEISAGDKRGRKQILCTEKNEMGKVQSAEENTVF